ncbi:hypothetical protein ACOMHN_041387 [Nucella lapillus]
MAKAEASDAEVDEMCCEYFRLCVEKEQAKKLPAEERKLGKGTTVRKILKDGLGESQSTISVCEASILSKHQDKKTKKIKEKDFVEKVLPELAATKCKCKPGDEKAVKELAKMKKKLTDGLPTLQGGGKSKNAAVVDRLTDTKGYTGAHKERFDASGKGKGIEGRETINDNTGYVGNYKGEGSYSKK